MAPEITPYEPGTPTDALHALWQSTMAALHPAYALPASKLHELLNFPTAHVLIATVDSTPIGFALTYTIRSGSAADPSSQHLRGGLPALVVSPSHQRQGVGSALHAAALDYLTSTVRGSFARSTPPATESAIQLGSAFPRIFPGPPDLPAFEPAIAFFSKRGWTFKDGRSTDLYGALPTGVDLEEFIAPARAKGVEFRAATARDEEEIMALQYSQFGSYTVSCKLEGRADGRGGRTCTRSTSRKGGWRISTSRCATARSSARRSPPCRAARCIGSSLGPQRLVSG